LKRRLRVRAKGAEHRREEDGGREVGGSPLRRAGRNVQKGVKEQLSESSQGACPVIKKRVAGTRIGNMGVGWKISRGTSFTAQKATASGKKGKRVTQLGRKGRGVRSPSSPVKVRPSRGNNLA